VAQTRTSFTKPSSAHSQISSKPPAAQTLSRRDRRTSSTSPPAPVERVVDITSDDFDWDLDVETTASVKLMIHYFYHHDYYDIERHRPYIINDMVLPRALYHQHSMMYAMGEKYGILGLKAVALAKFSDSGPRYIDMYQVSTAAVIAFNSTPESDKRLREEVLKLLDSCRRHWKNNVVVQEMILSTPEIAYGLYRKSVERES
jgi:hypothetical protein